LGGADACARHGVEFQGIVVVMPSFNVFMATTTIAIF